MEHGVTTSKIPFLSLLPRECMSRYFLKTVFMFARSIPVQTKKHFKNLQFIAVTYDMEALNCAFDGVKTTVYNCCILLRLTSGFVNPRTVMFTEAKPR